MRWQQLCRSDEFEAVIAEGQCQIWRNHARWREGGEKVGVPAAAVAEIWPGFRYN